MGGRGFWPPDPPPAGAIRPPADVFSLGVLVFQALTGRLPIATAAPGLLDAGYLERLRRCVVPETHSLRPEVPEALAAAVDRCLRRNPGERFADGRELLEELEKSEDVFGLYFERADGPQSAATAANPAWGPVSTPVSLFAEQESGVQAPEADFAARPRVGQRRTATSGLVRSGLGPEIVTVRGGLGERSVAVESIAADQEPFAVRLHPCTVSIAPGVELTARTVELGGGHFTNSYQLAIDPDLAGIRLHSDPRGFYLPDLLLEGGALAALSGSFSFISDEPDYQPAEPCLDFAHRGGETVSLPTAAKPAFLIRRGRPELRHLDARGTLRIGGRDFDWIGSKVERVPGDRIPGDTAGLLVYGAANCRVQYRPAPRIGLLRWVDPSGNSTPAEPECVDFVVNRGESGQLVTAVREGGGTDLFAGCYLLCGPRSLLRGTGQGGIAVGDRVEITAVDGLDCAEIDSGASIGPSLADTAAADTGLGAFDDSLGVSPFVPGRRHARTLIGLAEGRLLVRVLDGAPLSRTFQGVSCAEAATLVERDGFDPAHFYHLDGGQSSKLAIARDGGATVLGNLHYLLWPKTGAGPFQWCGTRGRLLHSALRFEAGSAAEPGRQ
jgi:hypothetical protein